MVATHNWRGLGVNRRQPEITLEHCDRLVAENLRLKNTERWQIVV